MAVRKQFSISTYNVKRYDISKIEEIKSIFRQSSMIVLQETWLTEDAFIQSFKRDFPLSECISSSIMGHNDIRLSRPHGGVGICYHSNLKCRTEIVPTISKRINALKITIHNIILLLTNVYMPSSDNTDDLEEYSKVLQEVSSICNNFPDHKLILGGDWNADPLRNDGRTRYFKSFIRNEELYNCLDHDSANVPYTFVCTKNGTTSTLDHFLISPNLVNSVISYETLDSHNNFSDHLPLKLTLSIDVESLTTVERNFRPCVAWHKCNDTHLSNYRDKIDKILLKLINPNHEALRCTNKNCVEHNTYISNLYNAIIKACAEASEACLPHNSHAGGKRIIPGWKEHVQEHADRAKLWHEVWVQKNKPRDGIYANLKRKSRMQYHYAIRSLMKDNIRI